MLKRVLLVLDVLLVAASVALAVHLYQIWTAAPATAAPPAIPSTAAAASEAPPAPTRTPAAPAAALAVIADHNLFSPTRAEVLEPPKLPTTGVPTIAARPVEKPRLYGIVISTDGGSRAYLWDPQSKKVFGYKVGDSVAESRVEQIGPDRVVLRRSTETFEVLLRDPSKPKPPPPAAAPPSPVPSQYPGQIPGQYPGQIPGQIPGSPGGPQVPGAPTEGEGAPPLVPGGPTAPTPPVQGPTVGVPGAPGTAPPRRPGLPGFVPGRPPLRVPQGAPGGQPVPVEPPQSGDAGP
jgi:hypothetical protein